MNSKEAPLFLSTIHQWYFTSYLTLISVVISTFILSQVSIVATTGGNSKANNNNNSSTVAMSTSIVVTMGSHFTHSHSFASSNDSSSASSNFITEKTDGHIHSRKKRGIMELAGMISCVTGCDPIKYKGYGCYCGYSGVGMPVDAIDRCCYHHDNCYTRTGCTQLKQYMLPYSFDCATHGYAVCANPYGNDCASRLCRCDLKFAHCLSSYRCPINRKRCGSPRLLLSLLSLG